MALKLYSIRNVRPFHEIRFSSRPSRCPEPPSIQTTIPLLALYELTLILLLGIVSVYHLQEKSPISSVGVQMVRLLGLPNRKFFKLNGTSLEVVRSPSWRFHLPYKPYESTFVRLFRALALECPVRTKLLLSSHAGDLSLTS